MPELPYKAFFQWLRAGLTVAWLVLTVFAWPYIQGINGTLETLKVNQEKQALLLAGIPNSVRLIIREFAEDPNNLTNVRLTGHEHRIRRLEEEH